MPKIQISQALFHTLLGEKLSFSELEAALVIAKAEIDEDVDEDGNLKIELNDTNRPDLWTVAGLARLLKTYRTKSSLQVMKEQYLRYATLHASSATDISSKLPVKEVVKKIIAHKSVENIRPFVQGFLVKGKKIDDVLLAELIQIQEKLCENFGQKRKSVAIGIYRENLIQWPVHYEAVDAKKFAFVPLDFDEALSLIDIVEKHPKGKEYGDIIKANANYPLLRDDAKEVLSMPPIINSAHVGAVQVGDEALFIECTGTTLEHLMLACNIIACDCIDLGFEVLGLPTEYEYEITTWNGKKKKNVVSPDYFQRPQETTVYEIERMLGMSLPAEDISIALARMGVSSKIEGEKISITVPVYRNDFLHGVDIIEDVMIGRGMDDFEPQHPKSFTIGKITEIETVSRKLIQTMVGLGFQEMLYPYLGSRVDFIEKMYKKEEWESVNQKMVQVENPISENYEFVRSSIFPNLLETERVSAHSPYPHKVCEIGKVAYIFEDDNCGTKTDTVLGFLIADSSIGFTDINAIIAAIFYYIDIDWKPINTLDSRFIEGRACEILRKDEDIKMPSIGIFGEVHPRILEGYGITVPCVAGEIVVERMLS